MERRVLKVRDVTAENFAPYGTLLGAVGQKGVSTGNYAATRVFNPSPNFRCDDGDGAMVVLAYEPRPMEVRFLERHYRHTQVFIPLGGKPLIGVFSPPTATDRPELSACEALRFDGSAGFVMNKGVWHEQPFPLQSGTHAICFLRNETVRELRLAGPDSKGECHGNDIDKLNIAERYGVVFDVVASPAKL